MFPRRARRRGRADAGARGVKHAGRLRIRSVRYVTARNAKGSDEPDREPKWRTLCQSARRGAHALERARLWSRWLALAPSSARRWALWGDAAHAELPFGSAPRFLPALFAPARSSASCCASSSFWWPARPPLPRVLGVRLRFGLRVVGCCTGLSPCRRVARWSLGCVPCLRMESTSTVISNAMDLSPLHALR